MKINNRASGISIRIAGGVFALFFLTFAQIQTTAHAEGPLVIATWGGLPDNAQMKNYVEPFTAETGIKIVLVPAPGKHVAQTEAATFVGQDSVGHDTRRIRCGPPLSQEQRLACQNTS